MADWSALAGFAGLASALDEIQNRRVKEAELQRQLTKDQGEWTPATGGGGFLGGLDQLLGYNRPGQVGFGGQTYQFQPYAPMTAADVTGLGLTYPETTTTPAYEKPLPPDVQGPLELVPEQQTTTDVPMPGFVGRRLDPKLRDLILQEKLKERFERFKLSEQQKLFDRVDTPGSTPTDTGGATFDLPGTGTPAGTPAGTPGQITQTPLTRAQTSQAAPTPPAQAAIPGVEKTSPQFMAKAQKISNDLGMRLDDFLRVISYETAGSFSPAQKNIGNRSSGTGLIQFLDKTAKGLGTTTEALAAMSPEQQLDYVAKYLAPYKGKIGNLQDLYMAVLSPASIGKSGNAVVFSKDTTPAEYTANAPLDVDKKGYITVSDATNALMRRTGATQATPTTPATQEGVPAATQDLPPGSVQVAGPGAGTPPTSPDTAAGTPPTAGTVPLNPAEPFALTPEGRQRIESNNRRTLANNQRLQALDVERRRVQVGIRAGMPGMTDRLNALEASVRALRQENTNFYDDSQKTLGEEQKEWRSKVQRLDERRRRPLEIAEEETSKRTAEERYLDTQPIGEHPRVKAEEYFDKKTGDPIDDAMLTRQWRAQNKVGNLTRLADTESRKQLTTLKMLEPLLKQYTDLVQYAYGTDRQTGKPGPLAQFARTPSGVASAMITQAAQSDPTLQAKRRALEGQLQSVVRALGSRGDLNEGELAAAKGLIANMDASMGLGLNIGAGLGTKGVGPMLGVKPSFSVPDTPAVGLKLANELVDLVNSRIGSLLRNKAYQGTPTITLPTVSFESRREIQQMTPDQIRRAPQDALAGVTKMSDLEGTALTTEQQKALAQRLKAGAPVAPVAPALTQPTGLNPAWVQQRLPAMTPDAIRTAPLEVLRDIHSPWDIKGLSTEQRKALATRLRERNAAAVKLRRAS